MDDKLLEKAFLTELEALEHFRISYTGLFREVPLSREDPDVRRLIEALAYFSGRTRLAAERVANESLMRLFHQHFPHAISPMPATTMLQANPSPRFVDAVSLPRGMEILVARKADLGQRPPYRFRTMAPLRVLPVQIEGIRTQAASGKLRRIFLQFTSAHPRNDEIGTLSLNINHLSDLTASMAVYFALKSHVRRASVIYGPLSGSDARGEGCGLAFGAVDGAPHEYEAFENPVQRFRAFLHFPQGELYIHFKDLKPPRNWQQFSICLDLDENWPGELTLTEDSFSLNTVPMVNIKHDMANPVECDGTQERYLVRHPDGASRFVCHSILGVYLLTDKGMVPVEPGVLGPTKYGYETLFDGKDEGRRGWVLLDIPEAFDAPQRVAIDAFWIQPELSGVQPEELRARLADRHIEGLQWHCSGAFVSPASTPLEDARDDLLAMTALKSKRFLDGDELTFLVRAFGALQRPEFARITMALTRVNLRTRPAGAKAGGISHVYGLTFDNLDPSDLPRLDLFCSKLLPLLRAWSIEQVVEIVATVPRLGRELHYAD
jgi:type VI secretion system protein ImpG